MTCKGKNCTSNGKTPHSSECRFEYAANVASGVKGFTMPSRTTDHIATLEFVRNHTSRTSEEIAAIDAAIALMRGQSEYVPAGFLLDGPSDWAFVPTRELIESRIAIVCFENGDDPDDYTATEVFVRLTKLPSPPKDTADEQ